MFGSAGFGKSTLLQWLCLQSASEEPDIKLNWLSDYAPALIKLRSLDTFKGLSFFDAIRQTSPHVVSDEDEPWFNDLAHDGRVVFMVDGFDEVPPKQRASAKRWLSELINEFSHCTFIVTSRPIPQSKEPEGFRTAYLEKMRPDDVSRFIRFWHNAVATGIRDEFFVERLYSLSEKLQDSVQSIPALRTLASNPLMCALLCTINCDRRGNIPLDKSDIYRVAVELMLDRRNYERGIENEIYDELGKKNVRAILQEISRWMVLNGLSEIKRSKFATSMRSMLKCEEEEEIDTKVSSLVERSGLLLEVPPRDIVFIHNQFKEFLAAESFIIENDIGLLKKNSQDVTWTEMLPLACGIMNRGQADDFISFLVDSVPEKTDATYRSRCFQLVSLAYHCPRLDTKTIDQVDAIAKSVLPPESVDEVFGILHLGTKLVELISSSSSAGRMSDQVAAMCIRALMEVGDESVVPLIASINLGAGRLASQAALTAWDYFGSEKYGELVIANIDHGYEIAWEYRTDLTGLRFAHKATAITLDNCVFDGNLCILPSPNSCKRFALHSPDSLDSLDELQSFSTLEELTISGLEEVRSFDFLCGLAQLRVLKLENCPALKDLKFLNSLDSLESLSIVGCFNLESIAGIERQDNLEELDLTGAFGIRDWSPLNRIQHTVEVSCKDSGFVYDQLSDDAKDLIYLN